MQSQLNYRPTNESIHALASANKGRQMRMRMAARPANVLGRPLEHATISLVCPLYASLVCQKKKWKFIQFFFKPFNGS
jgi:hypothetical protein